MQGTTEEEDRLMSLQETVGPSLLQYFSLRDHSWNALVADLVEKAGGKSSQEIALAGY